MKRRSTKTAMALEITCVVTLSRCYRGDARSALTYAARRYLQLDLDSDGDHITDQVEGGTVHQLLPL
eukprot:COSAG01_NODE_773_length_13704_cov_9.386843_11_plen_67_part_00